MQTIIPTATAAGAVVVVNSTPVHLPISVALSLCWTSASTPCAPIPSVVASWGWWALISTPVSIVLPIARNIGVRVWVAPARRSAAARASLSVVSAVTTVTVSATVAITLPCWAAAVVSVPAVVHGVSAAAIVAVSAVEAGRGAIGIGANTHRTALWSRRQGGLTVLELSAVELVALFVCWDLVRRHGQRCHFKVRVFEGVDGIDARSPVQFHQVLE